MFDIDGGKLLIIFIVALVVIGPKELPGVMRQVGQAVARLRRMASEFQGQFMEAMRESELEELRKDVSKMAKVDLDGLDPFQKVRSEMASVTADVQKALETRASDPVAASPGSVDMPALPTTPDAGEASIAAAGIAPVAETPAAPADAAVHPAPAEAAGPGGHP